MGRPSFQFFPDNWLTDIGLRQCSPSTRGIWADLLCLMHQGIPYGHLANKEGQLPIKFMAVQCGVTPRQLLSAIEELGRFEVYSKTDGGVIFSRRMVRDEATRTARAAGGIKSLGNPNVPRPKDTNKDILPNKKLCASHAGIGIGKEVNPQTTTKTEDFDPNPGWTKFYLEYPQHRINEFMDIRLWLSIVDSAETQKRVLDGLAKHKRSVAWHDGFVPRASKFLGERLFDTDPGPEYQPEPSSGTQYQKGDWVNGEWVAKQ